VPQEDLWLCSYWKNGNAAQLLGHCVQIINSATPTYPMKYHADKIVVDSEWHDWLQVGSFPQQSCVCELKFPLSFEMPGAYVPPGRMFLKRDSF
jgi:hypothetical protein